jgi:BolA family transcriptional regulator, general stress-responsive regulator
MGVVRDEIERRLKLDLSPERLEIRDDSAQHVGHAGHRPEGETHFFVEVVSRQFAGQGRVARQRQVYAALGDLMQQRIHALSISALTPDEAASSSR